MFSADWARFSRGCRWRLALVVLVAGAQAAALAPSAVAEDLTVALSDAEATVSSAETESEEARARLEPVRARYAAINSRAVPANRAAAAARRQADSLEADLVGGKQEAAAQIAETEASYREEVDDHDAAVSAGIALGLAAVVVAGIALGWGWFRATVAIAWLSEQQQAQAIGLCASGGLLLVIVGVALGGGGGIAGVIGDLLFLLGFVLPTALLLARHSAQVQRGRATAVTKRNRMPAWATNGTAAFAGGLALLVFATAVFAAEPSMPTFSAQLQREAEARPTSPELIAVEARAAGLSARASRLNADRRIARANLGSARTELRSAERSLVRAEGDVRRYTRRLAIVAKREQREEEAELEALEEEVEEESTFAGCDSNYSGCLDPNSVDYDCAGGSGDGPDYTGPVEVLGADHYGLDSDGDGYACE